MPFAKQTFLGLSSPEHNPMHPLAPCWVGEATRLFTQALPPPPRARVASLVDTARCQLTQAVRALGAWAQRGLPRGHSECPGQSRQAPKDQVLTELITAVSPRGPHPARPPSPPQEAAGRLEIITRPPGRGGLELLFLFGSSHVRNSFRLVPGRSSCCLACLGLACDSGMRGWLCVGAPGAGGARLGPREKPMIIFKK